MVYIGTVSHTHKALTLAAIEKGKHVCVEKPAALCLSDVQEMVDAAKAKGVFFFESTPKRINRSAMISSNCLHVCIVFVHLLLVFVLAMEYS